MKLPEYIVDSHVHFWDPARLDYPWLTGVPALSRAFLPQDYAAATGAVKTGKMIVVEACCTPAQNRAEAAWMAQLAAREPRLKGIVAHASLEQGRPVRAELAALAQIPTVKGVRRNLQGEAADFCLQPDFVAGVRALAEFDFSFDLCLVHHQLPAVTELVRRCPEVNFVLDHGGKPAIRQRLFEPWAGQLKTLAALPNVCCKLSGLLTEADLAHWQPADLRPYVRHTAECFGFDRVLFGGDWPVLTLAGDFSRWLTVLDILLEEAGEADWRKMLQTNAERIYHV